MSDLARALSEAEEGPPLTFVDLNCHLGGLRLALARAGLSHRLRIKRMLATERDPHARALYVHNFSSSVYPEMSALDPGRAAADFLLCRLPEPLIRRGSGPITELATGDFASVLRFAQRNAYLGMLLVLDGSVNPEDDNHRRTLRGLEELGYWTFSRALDSRGYCPLSEWYTFIVCLSRARFPERPDFQFPQAPEAGQTLFQARNLTPEILLNLKGVGDYDLQGRDLKPGRNWSAAWEPVTPNSGSELWAIEADPPTTPVRLPLPQVTRLLYEEVPVPLAQSVLDGLLVHLTAYQRYERRRAGAETPLN